jgi:hypothetical protein
MEGFSIKDLCLQDEISNSPPSTSDYEASEHYRERIRCPYCSQPIAFECEHNLLDSWVDYDRETVYKTNPAARLKDVWATMANRLTHDDMQPVLKQIERYANAIILVPIHIEIFEDLEARILFRELSVSEGLIDDIFQKLAQQYLEFN